MSLTKRTFICSQYSPLEHRSEPSRARGEELDWTFVAYNSEEENQHCFFCNVKARGFPVQVFIHALGLPSPDRRPCCYEWWSLEREVPTVAARSASVGQRWCAVSGFVRVLPLATCQCVCFESVTSAIDCALLLSGQPSIWLGANAFVLSKNECEK